MPYIQDTITDADNLPYDFPLEATVSELSLTPQPARNWQHRAARAVIADLQNRWGISEELSLIDPDIRQSIVRSLEEIISEVHLQHTLKQYES